MSQNARSDPSDSLASGVNQRLTPMVWVLIALLATVGWIAVLSFVTLRYSNPEIVSRPQLLAAPIVVEGRLLPSPPRLQVTRVWKGASELAKQELALAGVQVSLERPVIVPLLPSSGDQYRVFEIPEHPEFAPGMRSPSLDPRPIYSADDPGVVAQVKAILGGHSQK
ncbi:MAG: hypothetical protein U1D30_11750 [Planctomycetota bacterium]